MKGRTDVISEIERGFLCFDEKLADPTDAEAIVWSLCGASDFYSIFVNDILIRLGLTLFIVHVPTKGFKKRINKLPPKLGFVILTGMISLAITVESVN